MIREINNTQDIINLVGKETYVGLLKKYNLCTKKWTYGRAKGFYIELTKLIRLKTKELKNDKKDRRVG